MPRGGSRSNSRGSSGGGGGGFFSRGPARQPAAPPRPPPPRQAPRPAPTPTPAAAPQQGGGMMSGLAGTVMTGMAFGAGSEVAHQAVRSVMGGGGSGHGNQGGAPQEQQQQPQQMQQQQMQQPAGYTDSGYGQQQEAPCQAFNTNFVNCLKQNDSDIGMCQQYMDMIKQCERDQQMYQ